jgi:hypothetical protein
LVLENSSTKLNKKSDLFREKIKNKKSERSKRWPSTIDDVKLRAKAFNDGFSKHFQKRYLDEENQIEQRDGT